MNVVIYYYSSSGNTELACKCIANKIENVEFKLVDVTNCMDSEPKNYDIAGFAFPTHYLGIPEIFRRFVTNIENDHVKPAFLLNTYGMMQGKALRIVSELLNKKDFQIISGHALMTPESFPPFISKGWTSGDKPDEKQIKDFNNFILDLSNKFDGISRGITPEKCKIKIGFFNSLIGVKSRDSIKKDMGEFEIDMSLCNHCGRCVKYCCYNAVKMEQKPVFELNQCEGCWSCFNNCPQKAISKKKIKASSQYNGPDSILTSKFLC